MYVAQQYLYPQQVQSGQLVGAGVGAAQTFDISTLLTSIMPLIMLIMVMQLIKPLMKTAAGGD